ncbi:MAG TPA: hypothetical protein DEB65_10370 [Staphylococcus sp.]|uniref:hypothetical protein n=2 Tax=Mammaliicoccus lentus TaxID=42858 RepID=UPI000CD24FDE|nr:hypothetical protein [Mammaliicoccus lentus]HBV04653.1 hypothetical protein [Staphylococcus sp.]POA03569.1 hypothetical protein CD135_10185 [Mammaliicoccus lentus]QMU10859.1 hypothetical protein H3V22_01080 [Mammaliicoccus lentus]WGZ43535.1 hypothetical protein PN942_01080 [Mammaliicoccus lentus]SUM52100.1 Uncharacterised protein [Mammaliicoccus lentus]
MTALKNNLEYNFNPAGYKRKTTHEQYGRTFKDNKTFSKINKSTKMSFVMEGNNMSYFSNEDFRNFVSDYKENHKELKEEVTSCRTKVTELKEEVIEIKSSVGTLNNNVDSIDRSVSDIMDAKINTLKAEVTEKLSSIRSTTMWSALGIIAAIVFSGFFFR